MSYLEELLPEFRKGAKIRLKDWEEGLYIYWDNGYIYGEDKKRIDYSFNECSFWFNSPNWELYQEPIDWDYIIKNKCLCWFWDKVDDMFNDIGLLAAYNGQGFLSSDSFAYSHCRPVRRDEVTFYEDRKN